MCVCVLTFFHWETDFKLLFLIQHKISFNRLYFCASYNLFGIVYNKYLGKTVNLILIRLYICGTVRLS